MCEPGGQADVCVCVAQNNATAEIQAISAVAIGRGPDEGQRVSVPCRRERWLLLRRRGRRRCEFL